MFELFYRTLFIGIISSLRCFSYCLPLMAFVGAMNAAWAFAPEWFWEAWMYWTPVAAAIFFPLMTMYALASLRAMLQKEEPLPFLSAMRWRHGCGHFLAFLLPLFLVMAILIAVMGDVIGSLFSQIRELEELGRQEAADERASPWQQYGYGQSNVLVLLLGSRLMAGVFAVASLFVWFYFFRTLMRIPAFADNYDLSSEESLLMTSNSKGAIMAASLLVNVSVLSAIGALPWAGVALWLRAFLEGASLGLLVHANLALSVALYEKYSGGYDMRKASHF